MSKQSGSRNTHRGRRCFRLKLAVNIFVLLPICLWLVYEATLGAGSSKMEALDDGVDEYLMMNLGRKNLNPQLITEDSQKVLDEEEIEAIRVEEEVLGKGDLEGEGEQLEDLIDEDDSED